LVRDLGGRREEFIAALDVGVLARAANNAVDPGQLPVVAWLVRDLGGRREEFIAALDVSKLKAVTTKEAATFDLRWVDALGECTEILLSLISDMEQSLPSEDPEVSPADNSEENRQVNHKFVSASVTKTSRRRRRRLTGSEKSDP
jgi:hypothetical protein